MHLNLLLWRKSRGAACLALLLRRLPPVYVVGAQGGCWSRALVRAAGEVVDGVCAAGGDTRGAVEEAVAANRALVFDLPLWLWEPKPYPGSGGSRFQLRAFEVVEEALTAACARAAADCGALLPLLRARYVVVT